MTTINYNNVVAKWAELGAMNRAKTALWVNEVRWAIKTAEAKENQRMVAGQLAEAIIERGFMTDERAHELAIDIMAVRGKLDARCEVGANLAHYAESLKETLAKYGSGLDENERSTLTHLAALMEGQAKIIDTPPFGRFQPK